MAADFSHVQVVGVADRALAALQAQPADLTPEAHRLLAQRCGWHLGIPCGTLTPVSRADLGELHVRICSWFLPQTKPLPNLLSGEPEQIAAAGWAAPVRLVGVPCLYWSIPTCLLQAKALSNHKALLLLDCGQWLPKDVEETAWLTVAFR